MKTTKPATKDEIQLANELIALLRKYDTAFSNHRFSDRKHRIAQLTFNAIYDGLLPELECMLKRAAKLA